MLVLVEYDEAGSIDIVDYRGGEPKLPGYMHACAPCPCGTFLRLDMDDEVRVMLCVRS